jgi:hypothetical protein
MSKSAQDRENAAKCAAALLEAEGIAAENDLARDNNVELLKLYNEANNNWLNRKKAFEDNQNSLAQQNIDHINRWQNCRNNLNCDGEYHHLRDRVNQLRGERKTTGESVNPNEQWCKNDFGGGWTTHSRNANFANIGRMECKRSEQQVKDELGIGPEPNRYQKLEFQERMPRWGEGEFIEQPAKIFPTVQCCSNILECPPSSTCRNIIQTCKQELNVDQPPSQSPESSTPESSTPESSESTNESTNKVGIDEDNTNMIIIVVVIFIISFSLLAVLAVVFVGLSSGSGETPAPQMLYPYPYPSYPPKPPVPQDIFK